MSTTGQVKAPATYADLDLLPEHVVGEIVDGELHVSPRPAPRHARTTSALGFDIGGPFDRGRGGPGGWWILDEPELHLGNDVLVPDLAGWRRERMPGLPGTAHFDLAPDWACEVLSSRTEALDRTHKLRVYRRERVPYVWLCNPVSRTLEVYRWQESAWSVTTFGGDEVIRAEPFEAIELELRALWVEPAPPTSGGESA